MQADKKIFAFRLAAKTAAETKDRKWKAREGVAIAGCSEVQWQNYRAARPGSTTDNGIFC
jgi:hypothetical protein